MHGRLFGGHKGGKRAIGRMISLELDFIAYMAAPAIKHNCYYECYVDTKFYDKAGIDAVVFMGLG